MPGAITSSQMTFALEPQRHTFRVSELNAAVQRRFEIDFRGIWVAGEISGCRLATSGHYYFSLKDEQSQVKCALFKGSARFVKFKPRDGLAVLARGNLEVYEARGEYQLIIETLEPQGAGALQLAFEQLKKKLAEEGLFEQARKRPLPKFPKCIGIVTSPSGAVIRDILHVLERRFPGLHVRLYPAQVQGDFAQEQIRAGLDFFSSHQWADVVILARGGGSLEDLWTFNEEGVARAIAASRIPVISAIGHETDFTIADFVADYRAPTPSAAAEVVICTRDSVMEQVDGAWTKLLQALRYRLLMSHRSLQQRGTERTAALMHRAVARRAQRVDDLEFQLRRLQQEALNNGSLALTDLSRRLQATDLRLKFARHRHTQARLLERLTQALQTRLWQSRRQCESLDLHLRQISPLTVLSRGYAIVMTREGHVLRAASETAAGEQVKVRLHEGSLTAAITAVEPQV